MIELRELSGKAIKNSDFYIGRGESCLIKYDVKKKCTEFMDFLCNIKKPKEGEFYLKDEVISDLSYKEFKKLRKIFGIAFEEFNFISTKTVLENMMFPYNYHSINEDKAYKRAERLLKVFMLDRKSGFFIEELTYSEKQRLSIARALALNPEILILENPDRYLDIDEVESVDLLLRELKKSGKTIVILSDEDSNFSYEYSYRI